MNFFEKVLIDSRGDLMSISEYCTRDIITISKYSTVLKAVDIMKKNKLDELIVTEFKEGKVVPVGVLTSFDIIMNGSITEAEGKQVFVKDIMSSDVVICPEHFEIPETIDLMEQNGVKRCSVVNESGHLIGLIVASDLTQLLTQQLSTLTKFESRSLIGKTNLENLYDRL